MQTGIDHVEDTFDRLKGLGFASWGGTALDFGCVVGRLSQALCKHFDRVIGVDIAPSMIALAENFNQFSGSCCYVLNSREHLSFQRDSAVDFVLTHYRTAAHEARVQQTVCM